MLTELRGKGGGLCQQAKEGLIRCPLIIRPTSEDVITGHIFQTLLAINPRWWLAQLLNEALGAKRFRQQYFRRLKIELWQNKPPYPRDLLPWDEGSTQVDATITWENPPTTVFVEAKYGSGLSPRAKQDDGQSGFPSNQLIRNLRVGLLETGYFQDQGVFDRIPRDFVVIVLSPFANHALVTDYQNPELLKRGIPFSNLIARLPRKPFVGQLDYPGFNRVMNKARRYMTRAEQILTDTLTDYLNFKLDRVPHYRKVQQTKLFQEQSESDDRSTDQKRHRHVLGPSRLSGAAV